MTEQVNPAAHGKNICEFQEDVLVPVQDDRLKAAILATVQSCADEQTVDHVGAALIPSKDEIIRILEVLQDVLFPGFFGRQELSHSTLEYHLGNEMMILYDRLASQISRSIRHECRRIGESLCSMRTERARRSHNIRRKNTGAKVQTSSGRSRSLRRRSCVEEP